MRNKEYLSEYILEAETTRALSIDELKSLKSQFEDEGFDIELLKVRDPNETGDGEIGLDSKGGDVVIDIDNKFKQIYKKSDYIDKDFDSFFRFKFSPQKVEKSKIVTSFPETIKQSENNIYRFNSLNSYTKADLNFLGYGCCDYFIAYKEKVYSNDDYRMETSNYIKYATVYLDNGARHIVGGSGAPYSLLRKCSMLTTYSMAITAKVRSNIRCDSNVNEFDHWEITNMPISAPYQFYVNFYGSSNFSGSKLLDVAHNLIYKKGAKVNYTILAKTSDIVDFDLINLVNAYAIPENESENPNIFYPAFVQKYQDRSNESYKYVAFGNNYNGVGQVIGVSEFNLSETDEKKFPKYRQKTPLTNSNDVMFYGYYYKRLTYPSNSNLIRGPEVFKTRSISNVDYYCSEVPVKNTHPYQSTDRLTYNKHDLARSGGFNPVETGNLKLSTLECKLERINI